jgi:branched-chain amino acid transport system substrate-binding protein
VKDRARKSLSVLASASLMTVALSSAGMAQEVLKIGVTAPLSGAPAHAGIGARQGMEVAIDEWNAKGGVTIDGKPVKVQGVFEDTQGNPAQGVSAAQKLILNDKVSFVIGDSNASSVTLAVMDLSGPNKMPMMSCLAVSSAIAKKVEDNPERYKYFFKGNIQSDGYAVSIRDTYRYLMEKGQWKPERKSIAFIVEDTDYGRSVANQTAEAFKAEGWTVTSNNSVPQSTTNFNSILTKLVYQKPDILVSVFSGVDAPVALSKQIYEQGLKASHYAIYYPTTPGYLEGAGKTAEGLLWGPLLFDISQRPGDKLLDEKVRKKFNVPAGGDHAYGYDCMALVLDAFNRAGSKDPDAVAKAMLDSKFVGLHGKYVFDPKNHTVYFGPEYLPLPTAQIQNGKSVIIWPAAEATGKYIAPK